MTPEQRLRAGEILLLSTDSLPGLHALASLPAAAVKLRALKRSEGARPFLLLFARADDVFHFATTATQEQEAQLRELWPAPLTALLGPRPETPVDWVYEGRSLAARVPSAPGLIALLRRLGGPLYSTSANLAGQEPAAELGEARRRFPGLTAPDLGDRGDGRASTLVDFTGAPARLIRPGALPWPPP